VQEITLYLVIVVIILHECDKNLSGYIKAFFLQASRKICGAGNKGKDITY